MKIPPPYTITHEMVGLLTKIEANKTLIQTIIIPDEIVTNLTRQSLLKSSVFSAHIEGNTLLPEEITHPTQDETKQYERQEIENILNALSVIKDTPIPKIIDMPYLLELHKLVMHKLIHTSQAGVLRKEPSAIFDTFGNVIYMTPPPSEINNLLLNVLHVINDTDSIFPLIKAPLVHISFEKIHPFMDGNGRVGRLIFQTILAKHGYHFHWLLSIEELLEQKKQTYYTLLDQSDATNFILFILEILYQASENLKKQITSFPGKTLQEDILLPRRKEILYLIREQTILSFDQIHRRFLKIPARTLRYDIQQLEKKQFIQKVGTTRGALYQVKR